MASFAALLAVLVMAAPSSGAEEDTTASDAVAAQPASAVEAVGPAPVESPSEEETTPTEQPAAAEPGEPEPALAPTAAEPAFVPPAAEEPIADENSEATQGSVIKTSPGQRSAWSARDQKSSPRRGGAPGPGEPVTYGEFCQDLEANGSFLRQAYCEAGVDLLNDLCPQQAAPGRCFDDARLHPCVTRRFSAGCRQVIFRVGCANNDSFDCVLRAAMVNLFCSRYLEQTLCQDPGPSGNEPLRAGLAGKGGAETLVSLPERGSGDGGVGVADPGARGDAGIATRPPTAGRPPSPDEIPFTGLDTWLLIAGGLLLLAAGALARQSSRH